MYNVAVHYDDITCLEFTVDTLTEAVHRANAYANEHQLIINKINIVSVEYEN